MSMSERFWSRVEKSRYCWNWKAHKTPRGYGGICVNGKKQRAHRVAWTLERGEIPDGIFVLHECDNPSCVRPSHLFLGTQKDNMRDMIKKGRGVNDILKAVAARQNSPICPNGHLYTPETTDWSRVSNGNPSKRCKVCMKNRTKRYRERKAFRDKIKAMEATL